MSKAMLFAVLAAGLFWMAAAAGAEEWQYDARDDLIYYGPYPVAHWYGEGRTVRPRVSRAPAGAVVLSPRRESGYPVPIYRAPRLMPVLGPPVRRVVVRHVKVKRCGCR